MFHWICPECGQEIAPGVKECPVCEPQASPAPPPSTGHSVTAAQAPAVSSTVSVPEPPLRTVEPSPAPEVILQPEIILQPEVVLRPEVVEKPKPQAIPLSEPEALRGLPPSVLAEPETFADRLADLADRLHERVPYAAERIVPNAVTAREDVARVPIVLDVTPSRPLLAPPPSIRLLAEPQPPSVAEGMPADQVFHPRPATQQPRPHPPMGAEPSIPGTVLMPDRPRRVAAPALAALKDYRKAADRQMRPAVYPAKVASTAEGAAEPRITLPGPALPRELMSLQAAGLVPIRSGRGQAGSRGYGWTTRIVVVAMLLTAGLAAAYHVMPGGSTSAPVKPAPEPVPEQPVVAKNETSLARFVEVTGIRFMEVNKKPQIHYLVVNHSSAPLKSVMIYVTLRTSSAKPGQAPLARLSFRAPDLAANEAKEMFSSIERMSSPLDLPDWRDLRADVEVQ